MRFSFLSHVLLATRLAKSLPIEGFEGYEVASSTDSPGQWNDDLLIWDRSPQDGEEENPPVLDEEEAIPSDEDENSPSDEDENSPSDEDENTSSDEDENTSSGEDEYTSPDEDDTPSSDEDDTIFPVGDEPTPTEDDGETRVIIIVMQSSHSQIIDILRNNGVAISPDIEEPEDDPNKDYHELIEYIRNLNIGLPDDIDDSSTIDIEDSQLEEDYQKLISWLMEKYSSEGSGDITNGGDALDNAYRNVIEYLRSHGIFISREIEDPDDDANTDYHNLIAYVKSVLSNPIPDNIDDDDDDDDDIEDARLEEDYQALLQWITTINLVAKANEAIFAGYDELEEEYERVIVYVKRKFDFDMPPEVETIDRFSISDEQLDAEYESLISWLREAGIEVPEEYERLDEGDSKSEQFDKELRDLDAWLHEKYGLLDDEDDDD